MNKTMKGFLFTVTVFLVLTYILLSISVWVKAVEASERSFSEFYKESTVELAIEQITPPKVDNVTSIIMNRALFRLNERAIDYPLRQGPAGDESQYIRSAFRGLLVDGNATEDNFTGGVGLGAEEGSSLQGWVSNLNASLRAIGIYVSDFQVSHFNIGQSDINVLDYSFDMHLQLRDYANTASVSRDYHISNQLLINGLVDPALARESRDLTHGEAAVYRQFFFNRGLYDSPASLSVETLERGDGGQGWLYGYLASASGSLGTGTVPNALDESAIPVSARHSYILVGRFADITALTPELYDQFGGYIVTDAPGHPSACGLNLNEDNTFNPISYSGAACDHIGIDCGAGACTGKPFIVATGFSATSAPLCPSPGNATGARCALIVSASLPSEVSADPAKKVSSEPGGVYGIESMRDFVMCGYYGYNPDAPSYFQRLLDNSYSRNSSQFGIETFVIGEYANSSDYDLNSRLDRELFNSSIDGIRIRGMPGCRTPEACAASPSPSTGVFAASAATVASYGLGPIACTTGAGSGTGCG